MFCSKCGNQLTDTALFCEKCGTPVGSGSVSPSQTAAPESNVTPFPAPEPVPQPEEKKPEHTPKTRPNPTPLIIKEVIVGTLTFISGLACVLHLGTWINCIAMILGYYTTIGGKIGVGIGLLCFWGRTVVSIVNIVRINNGSDDDFSMDFKDWCWVIVPVLIFAVGSFLGGDPFIRGQRAIACAQTLIRDNLDYEQEKALEEQFTNTEWESEELDENNHNVTVTGFVPAFGEKISIKLRTKINEDRYEMQFVDIHRPGSNEELDPMDTLFMYGLMQGIKDVENNKKTEAETDTPAESQNNTETQNDIDEPVSDTDTKADAPAENNDYEGQWLNKIDETSVMEFKKASVGNAYLVSYSQSFGANDWSVWNCTALYDKDENYYSYNNGSWTDYTWNENGEEEKVNALHNLKGTFYIDNEGDLVWLEEDPESELHFTKMK